MKLFILLFTLLLAGCALNPGETRRITAWGIWAEAYGAIVGIGYWQSERGPNVKDQPADKPTDALKVLPEVKPTFIPAVPLPPLGYQGDNTLRNPL